MPRALQKNWIVEYSEAYGKISEAPSQYNIWCAISVIGAVLKNHVYFKRGQFTIYPNSYIILVGPPGVGKGSSIHPAYDLAKDPDLCNVIKDRVTAPKIIEKIAQGTVGVAASTGTGGTITMTKDCSAVLMSLELPVLITSSDWMLPFLCEAWDRTEYSYDTKNMGSSLIKGMCTSLIGACVPDYIRKLNKDITAAISGGFTARAIFVYAENVSQKIVWPQPLDSTPAGKQLMINLKNDLMHISNLKGEIKFTDLGALKFEEFYKQLTIKETDSDIVLHFKSRMLVHVIKAAMIFSCAERDTLTINDLDVTNAVTVLRHVLFNLDKAFRGVGESDIAEATARVQNLIERRQFVSRNEILRAVHRNVNQENLARILDTLVQIGFCSIKIVNGIAFFEHVRKTPVFSTAAINIKTPAQVVQDLTNSTSTPSTSTESTTPIPEPPKES